MTMKKDVNALLILARESRTGKTLAICIAWLCLYAVLRTGFRSEGASIEPIAPSKSAVASSEAAENAANVVDPLESENRVFNFPELRLGYMAAFLKKSGLELKCKPSERNLSAEGIDYNGRALSGILVDLLRPHGRGIVRDGSVVQVIPMELRQEHRRTEDGEPILTNHLRTQLSAEAGKDIDLWISSEPLLRLRIAAQPYFGEGDTDKIGFTIEARRNQKTWFEHEMETRIGESSRIEVRGTELMWCLIKPIRLEGTRIDYDVEFYNEASEPDQ
jgi:hypothetical protein